MTRLLSLAPLTLAAYMPFCAAAVRPVATPVEGPRPTLWAAPANPGLQDAFAGPWGLRHAPNPRARYMLVEHKHSGVNPGMTVRDEMGRQWSVKQAPATGEPAEGPIEVTLSRVLSAVGYHQPPVYYLPSFTLTDDWGTRTEAGGRFRLKLADLKDAGTWSWQQNPFVGSRPYQGLLVILLMFGASDLKNANNTLYRYTAGDRVEHWYVVRDLGTALGDTGRFAPRRGDPALFARQRFITSVRDGFVEFDYRGWHQELVRDRITPADVGWASALLSRLTPAQWRDAFRAGGFPPDIASRFISTLDANVALGLEVSRWQQPSLGR